jgi:hypothetical protein
MIGIGKQDVQRTIVAQDDVIKAAGKMDVGFVCNKAFLFAMALPAIY